MCGRQTHLYTWREVWEFSQPIPSNAFELPDPPPRWNVAPTMNCWVITADDARGSVAREMRWGLVPSWAKDLKIGAQCINARIETATEKPAFRAAWKARRCLVIASGYYEWQTWADGKQPFYLHPADGNVMMFGGLWETWTRGAQPIDSFSIVTRDAEGAPATVHDRMPLFLPRDALDTWLHGSANDAMAVALASPTPEIAVRRVSRRVNSSRNDGAALIEAVADEGVDASPGAPRTVVNE